MHTNRAEKVILKQDALGRVTHTREQREALLNEFERSGMKGLPFARMVGVNYQTFASWIQKRRRSRGDYARMTSKRSSTAQSGQKPRFSLPLQLVEVALPSAPVTPPPPLERMHCTSHACPNSRGGERPFEGSIGAWHLIARMTACVPCGR